MKIFRSFRMASITKNRIGKYLLYALGEIILVVIGILIALWFNERSEAKKLALETEQTARQIIKLIEKDNEDIDRVLKTWTKLGKSMDTILYQTDQKAAIDRSCISCKQVLNGIEMPTLTNRIPETISRKTLSEGPLLEKLTEVEFHYIEGVESAELFNGIITDYVTKIVEEWQYQQPWFIDFVSHGVCGEVCEDYFYESDDYRKKIAYYNLLLIDGYYYNLIEFIEKNKDYIQDLQVLLTTEETTNEIN